MTMSSEGLQFWTILARLRVRSPGVHVSMMYLPGRSVAVKNRSPGGWDRCRRPLVPPRQKPTLPPTRPHPLESIIMDFLVPLALLSEPTLRL